MEALFNGGVSKYGIFSSIGIFEKYGSCINSFRIESLSIELELFAYESLSENIMMCGGGFV
jgi:hypothetical protein